MSNIWFLDVDGTLFADFFSIRMIGIQPLVGDMDEFEKTCILDESAYNLCKPLGFMQRFMAECEKRGDVCYALTVANTSASYEQKKRIVKKHYPYIKDTLFVTGTDEKIPFIMNMRLRYANHTPILIEDTMSTIITAKKNNILAWHVTNIAYLFESEKQEYDKDMYDAIFCTGVKRYGT